jgi:hypothetical protein
MEDGLACHVLRQPLHTVNTAGVGQLMLHFLKPGWVKLAHFLNACGQGIEGVVQCRTHRGFSRTVNARRKQISHNWIIPKASRSKVTHGPSVSQ